MRQRGRPHSSLRVIQKRSNGIPCCFQGVHSHKRLLILVFSHRASANGTVGLNGLGTPSTFKGAAIRSCRRELYMGSQFQRSRCALHKDNERGEVEAPFLPFLTPRRDIVVRCTTKNPISSVFANSQGWSAESSYFYFFYAVQTMSAFVSR